MDKSIIVFGTADEGTMAQAENCLGEAEGFLLMADNHKGYGMPVGGVAAYKGKISPAGVGFDIACGNKAVKLDIKFDDIKYRLEDIAAEIWDTVSFGMGMKNKVTVESKCMESPLWETSPFLSAQEELRNKARKQLGTIGSGNHYIDVFKDANGFVWIGVHFGSRGLGHTIASYFMRAAGDNTNIMDETPHCLDVESDLGKDYIDCMLLAGEYAYEGRDWVCKTVANIVGGNITDEVHNHHNFAWEEEHDGETYWVVRKGATPAFPGEKGFVGSTMGDLSVIIEGIDSEASRKALYSTIHGAGRVMSRTQAAGKKKFVKTYQCGQRDCGGELPFRTLKANEPKPDCPKCGSQTHKRKEFKIISEGLINFDVVKKEMVEKGIILKGAGADECPAAYKVLDEVLKEHMGTIKILHTLVPLIVCMAGGDEFDPYKD